MAYHPLSKDTGGDARAEARRIMKVLDDMVRQYTPNEESFLKGIRLQLDGTAPITAKQLFWLRDIKDKHL